MTPLGWRWAGFVWGYALVWFLLNDRLKLLAYRILDPAKAKAAPAPDGKAEPKPDATAEPKPDATATTAPDVTPRSVTRVRQLYEQLGREDVRSVEEWEKACLLYTSDAADEEDSVDLGG